MVTSEAVDDVAGLVRPPVPPTLPSPQFGPDCRVVLRAPRSLAGTSGIVRRVLGHDREIEFRSALGTPMHIVLPLRQLALPADPAADA